VAAVEEGSIINMMINLGLMLLIGSITSKTPMQGIESRSSSSNSNSSLLMLTYLHGKSTAIRMIFSHGEADEDRELSPLDMQTDGLMKTAISTMAITLLMAIQI
jgi:hypothetical protein